MEIKTFAIIFIAIFLAEIGDKTQIATMLFATDKDVSKMVVFLASSTALVLASGIGVIAGDTLSVFIGERILSIIAGVGFVVIGSFLLMRIWI